MELTEMFKDPLFKGLTEKEKTILKNYCAVIAFEEEAMLFKNDSKLFSVYYILEGGIKLKNNKEVFHILTKSEMIGLNFIFNPEPIMFSAYATPGTTIIQIDSSILKSFIMSNSQFLNHIFSRSGNYYQQLIINLLECRSKKLNGAFASFLLYFDSKDGLKNLTRKEMGEILNYSRENITKVVKTFSDEGLIAEQDKCIKILDYAGLERLKKIG